MKKGKDLLVFAAIAAAAYFVSHITGIGCPIKFLTGISCGGCGMTRAWLSVAALDIKGAFYYHPLVFVPPVYCGVYAARRKIGERIFKIITNCFAFLFLAVYLIRLFDPGDSVVTFDIENGLIIKIFNALEGFTNG